jgi:hypothetical protein
MAICKCGHTFGYHNHGWRQTTCYVKVCDCNKFRRSRLRTWAAKL